MNRKMTYLVLLAVLGVVLPARAADPTLVGWWQFNEGSGTKAADSSGNKNDGTLSGPVTWDTGWDGTPCLSFNGPYNFVRVPDSPSLNMTDGITIAAWVNPRWTGNNRIMQKSTEGSDNQYRLLKEGGNNTRFHVPPFPNLQATDVIPAKGEWSHLAGTYDGKEIRIYLNGKVVASAAASGKMGTSNGPLFIGTKHSTAPAGDEYNGLMDDVRIYNRGLSEAEVKAFVPAKLKAMKPNPADGATGVGMPLLQWTAGDTAMFHAVYLGTTPDLTAANLVAPRQPITMFYYVAGLQPGVTYYWRIDEIDAAGVTTTGDVWKFRAAQKIAGDPKPGDGAKWVNPGVLTLTWLPGSTAIKHDVYFGTNTEEVKNGTGGTAKGTQLAPQFTTGALTASATYYWRVDEIEAGGTKHVGNVWSFETLRPGGGILGQYFSGLKPAGTPVLTRIDPKIDFTWDPGPAGVPAPFSVRWTGEIDVPFSEKYTFYASVKGGIRVWVNGKLVVEYWMQHHMEVAYDGSIALERGRYPIVIEFSDMQWSGTNAIVHIFWSSPSIPRQIIPAGPLQPPYWAQATYPRDKAVDVPQDVTLMWSAGYKAKQHDVYFGTDPNAVANATPKSAGTYIGRQALNKATYDPGTLDWNKTYYWRIDEVNDSDAASPWTGTVWSFTTANSVVVDNFETYNDNLAAKTTIFDTWVDGLTNGLSNSTVGNIDEPFAEQVIVHGGRQSMPMDYNNLKTPFFSEAQRAFAPALDCTVKGVDTLSLFFRGLTNNGPDTVYIALEDSAGKIAVVSYPDKLAVLSMKWIEWKIPLSQFAGVNAAKVGKVYVGVGDRKSPKAGGAGRLYFDDIRVIKAAP